MEYGDKTFKGEKLYLYQGFDPANANTTNKLLWRGQKAVVNQRDADILFLWKRVSSFAIPVTQLACSVPYWNMNVLYLVLWQCVCSCLLHSHFPLVRQIFSQTKIRGVFIIIYIFKWLLFTSYHFSLIEVATCMDYLGSSGWSCSRAVISFLFRKDGKKRFAAGFMRRAK